MDTASLRRHLRNYAQDRQPGDLTSIGKLKHGVYAGYTTRWHSTGENMRYLIIVGLLTAGISAPVSATIQTFKFTTTVTNEYFNGEETTGQGLSLVRVGDILRGRFTVDDRTVGTPFRNDIFYVNPIIDSRLTVFRSEGVVLTLVQRPVFFANGNQADYSQISLRDGDPLGRRDTAIFSVGGGDFDSGSAVGLFPDYPQVQFTSWLLAVRERCSSGSISSGDCVSTLPGYDFYDGASRLLDPANLLENRSAADFSIVFEYENGDAGEALASLDFVGRVPEPATWAMLVIGFGACGIAARRKAIPTISRA